MAMIETARTAPFGAITTYQATSVLTNLAATVSTWIQDRIEARRTADALSRLNSRMLDDIGLIPADVDAFRARF